MIISTPDVVSGAYRYVGCYQQVFYDSYFTSSYMEPNLCFRLCETPLIFIQDTVCRCSGSGLMHYDRHRDRYCSTPCRQPGNPQVKTTEKCGGTEMYSLYAEENFYTRHAHLLDYRIQYSSCQFWNRSDYYDTFKVNIDGSSTKSPLNRLETCAAACLDQNSTTTSIGFNGNDKQCSCIIPKQLNENSDRSLYLTILSTDKCDLHCKNIVTNSKVEHPFTCGSSTDQRIWAVYNLTDLCPTDSVYIKDLKHCMFANTDIFYSCPSPSVKYVYNGDLTWNTFLKVIKKFNLTKSIVSVDFDDAVIIDSSWKCPTNKTDNIIKSNISDTNYFQQSSSANYVLDNGCLRKSTYSVSSQMPVNYLCLTYPINKKSPLDDEAHLLGSYRYISRARVVCPPNWFDLNGQCYRMSNEPRKIQEAKNSCFNISESEEKENLGQIDRLLLDTEEKNELVKEFKKFISDYLKGEIVQYTSRWQARLGFYLLDTNVSKIESTNAKFEEAPMHSLSIPVIIPSPPVPAVGINVSSINEFQMINPNENNNSTMKDDSCIVVTRPMVDKQGSSILQTTQINHCSKPIHVLCRTKTKLAVPLHPVCLEKPLTLGLPAMISNYLTHELCLSVCKKLAVKVAVLHMNKCYCFNYALARSSILKPSYEKHQKQHCGNPCPGNQNEYCGNNNTVVAINSAGVTLSSIYDNIDIFKSLYPDFIHDACIHVDSAKQSTMYGFYLNRSSDVHPRHCLELCTKYEQKYALLNSNKCLCTNIQIQTRETDSWSLPQDNNCTDECQGNYFYSCGNINNSSIYSVYSMQLNCPPDFQNAQDVNGFCYKINVHEITWQEAKSQCERENAALFIPENFEALQLIKLLFLRRQSYTSSGFAHVGVTYDNKNSTIKKYNANNKSSVVTAVEITGPNILCEATFLRQYGQLMSSSILSTKDKERLKNEQTACAYVDVRSEDSDYVSCDDIRCNRSAAVICQKAPITGMRLVVAKSSPMNKQFNLHTSSKPVGRRFPLTLFLFVTVCVAILTGSICLLYNRYLKRNNNTRRRTARDNDDSIYSPLATGNDFNLH
ncbi:unnamed protein product [Rotaria magnacalcarata]|uniref:WSC domain-containing protein n=1 Tax=Rotaria magnacalcarata TaxID=392030 RepID=A0A817ALC9_9BILA|nr:unnamed protein product [Rotaria magnacalcarata]